MNRVLIQILIGCALVAIILLPALLDSDRDAKAAHPGPPPSSDILNASP